MTELGLEERQALAAYRLAEAERRDRVAHAVATGQIACVACGCTEDWACEEGCAWVSDADPPLCTACAEKGWGRDEVTERAEDLMGLTADLNEGAPDEG